MTIGHLPEAVIQLDEVSKRFAPDVLALDHVSLTVRAGEVAVLLGLSGSGIDTAAARGRPAATDRGHGHRARHRCRLGPRGSSADVDGGGLLCLPGLVDVHSDGLEKERMPRPGAGLPWDFAVVSFEGKLRAAGVTTVFHGAAFGNGGSPATDRSVHGAMRLCEAVARRGAAPVDHRILHRLDVRCPQGLAALRDHLSGVDDCAVVSHEDHTPGQGQYADRRYYEQFLVGTHGVSESQARSQVDEMIADRGSRLPVREEALGWLGEGPVGCGAAARPRSGVGCRDRRAGCAGRSGGRVPHDGGGGNGGPGPGAGGGDGRAERAARFLALRQRLRR